MHRPFEALGAVDYDHSSCGSFRKQSEKAVTVGGHIACPIRLDYNSFNWIAEEGFYLQNEDNTDK